MFVAATIVDVGDVNDAEEIDTEEVPGRLVLKLTDDVEVFRAATLVELRRGVTEATAVLEAATFCVVFDLSGVVVIVTVVAVVVQVTRTVLTRGRLVDEEVTDDMELELREEEDIDAGTDTELLERVVAEEAIGMIAVRDVGTAISLALAAFPCRISLS